MLPGIVGLRSYYICDILLAEYNSYFTNSLVGVGSIYYLLYFSHVFQKLLHVSVLLHGEFTFSMSSLAKGNGNVSVPHAQLLLGKGKKIIPMSF